jgi:SAM-dependent methyltransferase
MRPGITEEDKQNMVQLYYAGKGPTEIAEMYNILYYHVRAILKYRGVASIQAPRPTAAMVDKFVAQYQQGISSEVIAANFGIDGGTVRRALRKRGIIIRPAQQNKRKYNININYFEKIDTEEKAYFLGILYADGSLTSGSGIKITLKDHDIDILEKLSNIIYGFRKLKEYQKTIKDENGNIEIRKYFTLNFYSKKMNNDLCKLGCTPRKSFTITFPEKLIDPSLIRHFIRGYFDGDGCICITDPARPRVDFTSNGEFIVGLVEFLEKTLKFKCNKIGQRHKDTKTRNIQILGYEKVKILLDYLYNDATIYMNRKYNKYLEMLTQLANKNNKHSIFSKYGTTYIPEYNGNLLTSEYLKSINNSELINNIAEFLFSFYRENGYPYDRLDNDELLDEFMTIKNIDLSSISDPEKQNILYISNTAGTDIIKHFSPHLHDVSSGIDKRKSMFEAFNDDNILMRVIKNRLGYKFNMTGAMLKQGLKNSKLAFKTSTFNTPIAKYIYSTYCNNGSIIYDYSMGFGQRLLAALSLPFAVKYIGIDPYEKSVISNQNIFDFYKNSIPGFKSDAEIIKDGSENYCDEKYLGKADIAFSSPPYFTAEIYEKDNPKQAAFDGSYYNFINIWWRKTVSNIDKLLKPGGIFAINIMNKANKYDLAEDMTNVIKENGYDLIQTFNISLTRTFNINKMDNSKKYEPIFIFRNRR